MMPRRFFNKRLKQRGVTLIELLVALGLGLLVTVIATTALLLGQQGYRSVDATTQLRDRERFSNDLIARVVLQAGYQDLGATNVSLRSTAKLLDLDGDGVPDDPEPDVYGWNNAVYDTPANLVLSEGTKITNGGRLASCGTVTDTSCRNGSDVLVVRYQGVNSSPTSVTTDNTMINCAGRGEAGLTGGNLNDRAVSMFHVTRQPNGEPSLSCSYYIGGNWLSVPMIEGVESFQVLFGTDGVAPNLIPGVGAVQDTVPERWLRADELTVAGNFPATRENWRRVRAVRVGMVMRGPVGSAQQVAATTFQPLGSLYVAAADTGSALSVVADGRLRLQTVFTVHLRNDLTLRR